MFLWRYSDDYAVSAYTPTARTGAAASHANASWGSATSVRFSTSGEHFLAVGSGGTVALWRLDMGRALCSGDGSGVADPFEMGAADWSLPCFSKVRTRHGAARRDGIRRDSTRNPT